MLQEAVNDRPIGIWKNVYQVTSATAESTITLASMNDYKQIAIQLYENGGYSYNPTVIPISVFKNGDWFYSSYIQNYYCRAKYVSDTQIKVNSVGYGMCIYYVR